MNGNKFTPLPPHIKEDLHNFRSSSSKYFNHTIKTAIFVNFFILLRHFINLTAFITLLYRVMINNKLYEQYKNMFQKLYVGVEKFDKEQEKQVVGIVSNFIINLVYLCIN